MGRTKNIIKKQQYIRKEIYSKDLSVLLESDTGKKIYGKFMNIADETAQAWLQGVVDLVEILHIDIQGLDVLYPLKMIFRLGIKNLNVHSEKIKTALL